MLTFVLLYIIIMVSLGVITPTYVKIYMYIFLHMYSVYQNIISGRFRWEQCSHPRKKWAFIVPLYVFDGTKSPHKFAHFFLFGVLTTFSLFTLVGRFPPVSCIGEYPEKRHFFKMVVERTAIRLCKRDTRKCVFFAWIMLTFDFLCSIIVLLQSNTLL